MSMTQCIQKFYVSAGILGENIFYPPFYRANLSVDAYLKMLKSTINPLITEVIENVVRG